MSVVENFPGMFPVITVQTFYACSRIAHNDDLVREVYQVYSKVVTMARVQPIRPSTPVIDKTVRHLAQD